jgi:hypothetical protein
MACARLLDLTHPPLGDSPTAWCAAVHGALRRHKRRVSNAARIQAGVTGLYLYCASLQNGLCTLLKDALCHLPRMTRQIEHSCAKTLYHLPSTLCLSVMPQGMKCASWV